MKDNTFSIFNNPLPTSDTKSKQSADSAYVCVGGRVDMCVGVCVAQYFCLILPNTFRRLTPLQTLRDLLLAHRLQ